jgi:hypothetical protein
MIALMGVAPNKVSIFLRNVLSTSGFTTKLSSTSVTEPLST